VIIEDFSFARSPINYIYRLTRPDSLSRVIVEGFSFVFDESNRVRSPAWRLGATEDQIRELVRIFERYSPRTGI
jgi:hypothetical protein